MEVLQGEICFLVAQSGLDGLVGSSPSSGACLSPSRMGRRFPQYAALGFAEIMQLRVVLINERAD